MKREIINIKTNEVICIEADSAYYALIEFVQHMDNLSGIHTNTVCFSSNNRYMILEYGSDVYVCRLERRVSYNI